MCLNVPIKLNFCHICLSIFRVFFRLLSAFFVLQTIFIIHHLISFIWFQYKHQFPFNRNIYLYTFQSAFSLCNSLFFPLWLFNAEFRARNQIIFFFIIIEINILINCYTNKQSKSRKRNYLKRPEKHPTKT